MPYYGLHFSNEGDLLRNDSHLASLGFSTDGNFTWTFGPDKLGILGTHGNVIVQGSLGLGTSGAVKKHINITLTPTQLAAMNGTAVNLLPGPGVGKCYVIDGPVHYRMTFGTAALSSGGAVVIQYHGSTIAATGTMAASQVNISSGTSETIVLPVAATPTPSTGTLTTDAGALEITNATGAFTTNSSTGNLVIDFDVYIV